MHMSEKENGDINPIKKTNINWNLQAMKWDQCTEHCRRNRWKRRKKFLRLCKIRCSTWRCECCRSAASFQNTSWCKAARADSVFRLRIRTCPESRWSRRWRDERRCWGWPSTCSICEIRRFQLWMRVGWQSKQF